LPAIVAKSEPPQTAVRRYSLGVAPVALRKAPLNELAELNPTAIAISVTD
jgi:hypothetical protein